VLPFTCEFETTLGAKSPKPNQTKPNQTKPNQNQFTRRDSISLNSKRHTAIYEP